MRYLPSVTEVLAPWVDFSRVNPETLHAASERGTLVHQACAMHAQGMWGFVTPPDIAGYVDSFRLWFDRFVGDVILIEERLFDEANGYCGALDLYCRVRGRDEEEGLLNDNILIDFKTPVALSKSWGVQLSAYKNLLAVNGYKVDRAGSLRLNPDGKIPSMTWYEGGAQDFNIFLSCLNAFRFFRG